ncbi:hypothetical protein C3B51_02210 [Pseudoalteromonas rubra]|uniref:HTH araC/xylS-type domain-containing protein n=1 Tax=Pseudoalteromonas rubra TaxID=43658 RepID=A0A4Q7END0_9GAMM|nr:AraC family transcriptional regulator [Pseudoalteromonas rubra]RZM84963.1 hypothetical protein C3B51_02210 [Pseudoalteromonas rubra]
MFTSLSISGLTVFQLIFAWQMCFAAILVWQNPHSRCLVLFFVFQTLLCLANVLESAGFTLAGYVITPAFTVAMGPVWYLSVRNLIGASTGGLQSARHLLLPLVSLGLTHYVQPLIALGSIMLLGYLVASLKLLRDYRDTVYQVHADAATMDLSWLTRLLGVYAVLSVTDFVRMNVQPITPMPWKAYWYLAHEVGFFAILSVLLIGVIKQPQVFNRLAQYQTLSQRDDAAQDTQLAQSIFAAVDAQVREQGLFCQPRLSIQHIADQLSLGVKQVSWAINSVSGNNFSNYINEVRLEQIEKQLADPAYAEASVLDIAMNNGFNAKSTFNQAFKARTGMTPTRFRQGTLEN